jgi:hypothetical protein
MVAPPFGVGPQYPPTTTGLSYPQYPGPPPGPYGYPRPQQALDPLLSVGGTLVTVGGLIVGVGWLIPTDLFWIFLGIGWMMFGPGVGIGLIGLGRQRAGRG